MIQIDAQTRALLLDNSVSRQIILRFPDDDFEITAGNIVSESFELTQSICDGKDFRLGGGVAGKMQIKVIGVDANLVGKRVFVYLNTVYSLNRLVPSTTLYPSARLLPGEPRNTLEYLLFTGKIYSSKKQKNRTVKELVAYDVMYDFSKISVTSNALTSYAQHYPTPQLKRFVTDLASWYGYDDITADQTGGFQNNRLLLFDEDSIRACAKKGVKMSEILKAYAEANVGFIVCKGDGSLHVRSLTEYVNPGIYDFTTRKKSVDEVIPAYRSLSFEEYVTKPITWLSFLYQNDKKYLYGSSEANSWYVSENIIFRMCSNISHFVTGMWDTNGGNYIFYYLLTFRPFKADVFARWWLEPGDRVQISTGHTDVQTVDSFVFSRKIKGINGMSVTIEAKGNEYLDNREVEVIE